MNIKVRLFSIAKELAGFGEAMMEIPSDSPAASVVQKLVESHPGFAEWKSSLRLAVNQEYVTDDHPLHEGDEVAVIPPVSGG
jgi:molybdopterin converting factor subunit 1